MRSSGLQGKYNDPNDRRIKECTHVFLSLAFVLVDDVWESFALLKRTWREDDNFQPIVRYFEKTCVNGTPRRGQLPAVPAKYAPNIWNHYQSALDRAHKTNNVSKAWHNRFAIVVGKHHPTSIRPLQNYTMNKQTQTV